MYVQCHNVIKHKTQCNVVQNTRKSKKNKKQKKQKKKKNKKKHHDEICRI